MSRHVDPVSSIIDGLDTSFASIIGCPAITGHTLILLAGMPKVLSNKINVGMC